jgi:putative transposase
LHSIGTFLQSTCGWFTTVVAAVSSLLKSRAALQLENVALRHQITVLQRSVKRPRLTAFDHLAWVWLSGIWSD